MGTQWENRMICTHKLKLFATNGNHTWAGEKSWGGFAYTYVISFDFDSGVGIPVTLTFWPGG